MYDSLTCNLGALISKTKPLFGLWPLSYESYSGSGKVVALWNHVCCISCLLIHVMHIEVRVHVTICCVVSGFYVKDSRPPLSDVHCHRVTGFTM